MFRKEEVSHKKGSFGEVKIKGKFIKEKEKNTSQYIFWEFLFLLQNLLPVLINNQRSKRHMSKAVILIYFWFLFLNSQFLILIFFWLIFLNPLLWNFKVSLINQLHLSITHLPPVQILFNISNHLCTTYQILNNISNHLQTTSSDSFQYYKLPTTYKKRFFLTFQI